jgi:hypothetical protein
MFCSSPFYRELWAHVFLGPDLRKVKKLDPGPIEFRPETDRT